MSLLSTLQTTGRIQKPPRLMIYGPQKIGKSTFGASAPSPVFIQIEDGLDGLKGADGQPIEVPCFPQAESLGDVYAAISALLNEDHTFQTVIVDSLDWMESLIWKKVCVAEDVDNIEKVGGGFNKGYIKALADWRDFIAGMNALRDRRGMSVILLAHHEIKLFKNPNGSDYDRYQPKLHKTAGGLVQEFVDVIGFANWETMIVEEKAGFHKDNVKKKARGSGRRLLHLEERPSYLAGNRYGLPPTVDFNWPSFYAAFTQATAPAAPQQAA